MSLLTIRDMTWDPLRIWVFHDIHVYSIFGIHPELIWQWDEVCRYGVLVFACIYTSKLQSMDH